MLVQVLPLDASKPNVVELERVYLTFVIASDDKHGVSEKMSGEPFRVMLRTLWFERLTCGLRARHAHLRMHSVCIPRPSDLD